MDLTPISRKYVDLLVSGTGSDGETVSITSCLVAITEPKQMPHEATSWVAFPVTAGVLRVLLIGPEADPINGGIVVAQTSDLWVRVDNEPEVLPAKVGTVKVSA